MPTTQSPVNHHHKLSEPTANGEPEPATVIEPLPLKATELVIAPEPEPQVSDQVRELTAQATVDTAVEIEGAKENPAHCATAVGEQKLDLGDLIDWNTELQICPSSVLSFWQEIPHNLSLPAQTLLQSCDPLASPWNLAPSSPPEPIRPPALPGSC